VACRTACSADTDCASGNYCSAQACGAKKTQGAACAASNECTSNFCVDGFCCNAACTGACQACSAAKKGSGNNGACGNIAVGTDPDNECTAQATSTCGTNGFCSGSGACQLYTAGTVCAASSCTAGVETRADTCNGSGTCVDNTTKSCSPYICGATTCKTSCANNSDCVASYTCSAGTCVMPGGGANGSSCSMASQCTSGFCVDGYCCDSACTGLCYSCSGAKNVFGNGICSYVTEFTDPDGECVDPKICCVGVCQYSFNCPVFQPPRAEQSR
jgi:hypothetical protein